MRRTTCRMLSSVGITAAEIEKKLRASSRLEPAEVHVQDTSSGCGSFFQIKVVSPVFQGKPLIQQHRLVNEVLRDEIKEIHGFTLETKAK